MTCHINAIVSDRQCAINHLRGVMENEGPCYPCASCRLGRQNRMKYPDLHLTMDSYNHLPIVQHNPLRRSKTQTPASRPPKRKSNPKPLPTWQELRIRIREDWR